MFAKRLHTNSRIFSVNIRYLKVASNSCPLIVYKATCLGKSIAHPTISPLVNVGAYCFPIPEPVCLAVIATITPCSWFPPRQTIQRGGRITESNPSVTLLIEPWKVNTHLIGLIRSSLQNNISHKTMGSGGKDEASESLPVAGPLNFISKPSLANICHPDFSP
jgi:hypothetical protein